MSEPTVSVLKTYKLFLGGAFPRSESGRSYEVVDHEGRFVANCAQGSRKDVRDAVQAARKGQEQWWSQTAANRCLVLYRAAEMLEGRKATFTEHVTQAEGVSAETARALVTKSIDRLVYYAGWCDKLAQIRGGSNPVAGPYFTFTVPEPTGVIGVIAPQESSLLGLISVVAPILAAGNAVVVATSEQRPIPAMEFAEVLATSDLPAGVCNLLTGRLGELAPTLASHHDVDGLDLAGAPQEMVAPLVAAASATITRVQRPALATEWDDDPGTKRLTAFTELKTVWHTIGR